MEWVKENLFSIVNLAALILLSLWGRAWVNRKKADLEKEIEGVKASHSKELFIHKLQFEKEFKIYEYLWMNIAHFQGALNLFSDPEDKGQLDEITRLFKKVKETIINNIPFYSKEIHDKAELILNLSTGPVLFSVYQKKINIERLEEIKKEISIICNGIEKAIRERINNMGKAKIIE